MSSAAARRASGKPCLRVSAYHGTRKNHGVTHRPVTTAEDSTGQRRKIRWRRRERARTDSLPLADYNTLRWFSDGGNTVGDGGRRVDIATLATTGAQQKRKPTNCRVALRRLDAADAWHWRRSVESTNRRTDVPNAKNVGGGGNGMTTIAAAAVRFCRLTLSPVRCRVRGGATMTATTTSWSSSRGERYTRVRLGGHLSAGYPVRPR